MFELKKTGLWFLFSQPDKKVANMNILVATRAYLRSSFEILFSFCLLGYEPTTPKPRTTCAKGEKAKGTREG